MNRVQVVSDREIDAIRRSSRHYAIKDGIALGVILAVIVCAAVGWALDSWRVANHERLLREATATIDARLRECQDTVGRISGYPYEPVARLQRQIDAAQGVRP